MKLLVIILNYRVTDLTIACLESLAPEVARAPGIRVAICENGSGGDAETRLADAIGRNGWGAWASLSSVMPNRGFTGGNNLVIRRALASDEPPDYFLLLNADTLVHPGALQALVRFMDGNPRVGIAGSRLDFPDGSPNGSPFRFPGVVSELERGLQLGLATRLLSRWTVNVPAPTTACRVDWVSGASMIIRREVIATIGALDEGLYTYFDDVDYCLNAKRAGWETWYVPGSRIVHIDGAATGITHTNRSRRPAYWFQARRRFFLKNHGALYAACADAAFLLGYCLLHARRKLQGKLDTDPQNFLVDSFRHSVFVSGFGVRPVENPALRGHPVAAEPQD